MIPVCPTFLDFTIALDTLWRALPWLLQSSVYSSPPKRHACTNFHHCRRRLCCASHTGSIRSEALPAELVLALQQDPAENVHVDLVCNAVILLSGDPGEPPPPPPYRVGCLGGVDSNP